eukprot:c28368_g1_i1 orf=229-2787(+)
MGKTVKSSKKFAKRHLKNSITCRRKLKPMRKALCLKQASLQSGDNKKQQGLASHKVGVVKKKLQGMEIDEFMNGDFLDIQSEDENAASEEDCSVSDDSLSIKDEENFIDITPSEVQDDISEDEDGDDGSGLFSENKSLRTEIKKHKKQLEGLKQKDPEFFQFLKEHDTELLEFSDEDEEPEDAGLAQVRLGTDENSEERLTKLEAPTLNLTATLVDSWCQAIKNKQHMGALRNLLRAFRTACHYGDGQEEEFSSKYIINSSNVFNKIMVFTLGEIDGVFRKFLYVDIIEEKSIKSMTITDLRKQSCWEKVEPLIKSYFGNALHVLNQMTDSQMIAFTLQRLKASIVFLGAFPKLARKFLKVALHFWGRGEGALPLISFLFVRDIAIWLGTDYLEACLKGIYKEYAANSKFISPSVLPRVHFMANCVIELYGIDLVASYQYAFIFIRQLSIVLRNALTMKTKESFKNVYSWQYISCLELWVKVLCTYAEKNELQPLVYPMAQIIGGVACLLPTARYFPLRFQCVKMLNRLASGTGTFIPVAALLLDMLEFKELRSTPTGGVGKAIDLGVILKVTKPTLKTRGFQDECVLGVIEQLVGHLAQWSYAIAFPELALVPLLRLRRFLKETKVDRFYRQIKQLIDQIETNIEYVTRTRDGVTFAPKDVSSVSSFLQSEKQAGSSPLSQYQIILRQKAEERHARLHTSSVLIPGQQSIPNMSLPEDGDNADCLKDGSKVFNSDWFPSGMPKKYAERNKAKPEMVEEAGNEETEAEADADDILLDLELSSDDNGETVKDTGKLQSPARQQKELKKAMLKKNQRLGNGKTKAKRDAERITLLSEKVQKNFKPKRKKGKGTT